MNSLNNWPKILIQERGRTIEMFLVMVKDSKLNGLTCIQKIQGKAGFYASCIDQCKFWFISI